MDEEKLKERAIKYLVFALHNGVSDCWYTATTDINEALSCILLLRKLADAKEGVSRKGE